MNIKFSSIVASTVLAAGLAAMSATAALADNVFSDLAVWSQTSVSGNDDVDAIESLFGQEVIEGYSLDNYKVDSKSGSNSYFEIEQLNEGVGTLTFKDSSLANSTFAFVLKAGNGFDAYLFEGVDVGTALNWSTANGKDLSHATLYVFDQGTPDPSQNVPEPATVFGLLAVGGMLVGKKVMDRKN